MEKDCDRLVHWNDIKRLIPYSAAEIKRMELEGSFPRRTKIGNRLTWPLNEILRWKEDWNSKPPSIVRFFKKTKNSTDRNA